MDLLDKSNLEIYQWIYSTEVILKSISGFRVKLETLSCIVNPGVDLLYLSNLDIHQWLLSRIRISVVVLSIQEWIYSTQAILTSTSDSEKNPKPCGCIVNPVVDLLYLGNFDIHQWFLSRIRNPISLFKIHERNYSTLITLVSTSGFEVKLETLWL